MAETPCGGMTDAQIAIQRMKDNEIRFDTFVNAPNNETTYTTNTVPTKTVPTLPAVVSKIQTDVNTLKNDVTTQVNDLVADVNSDFAEFLDDWRTQLAAESKAAAEEACACAEDAEAAKDRAEEILAEVKISTNAYNQRGMVIATQNYAANAQFTLPVNYQPTRKVLQVYVNSELWTAKTDDVNTTGKYQYEEVGTDPATVTNKIKLAAPIRTGDKIEAFVLTSQTGYNLDQQEALLEQTQAAQQAASTSATNAAASATAANTAKTAAQEAAEQAEEALAAIPNVTTADNGKVMTVINGVWNKGFVYLVAESEDAAMTLSEANPDILVFYPEG